MGTCAQSSRAARRSHLPIRIGSVLTCSPSDCTWRDPASQAGLANVRSLVTRPCVSVPLSRIVTHGGMGHRESDGVKDTQTVDDVSEPLSQAIASRTHVPSFGPLPPSVPWPTAPNGNHGLRRGVRRSQAISHSCRGGLTRQARPFAERTTGSAGVALTQPRASRSNGSATSPAASAPRNGTARTCRCGTARARAARRLPLLVSRPVTLCVTRPPSDRSWPQRPSRA